MGNEPDFALCGVARTGLTTLWQSIPKHPDRGLSVLVPCTKPSWVGTCGCSVPTQEECRAAYEPLATNWFLKPVSVGDRSLPAELIASVTIPALVISGEQSPPFLRAGARAVAEALPNGRLSSLAGQGHDISPEATAPIMAEFLGS